MTGATGARSDPGGATVAQQFAAWLDSVLSGRVLQPGYGVCEVCDRLHGGRDSSGELRNLCRCCLVELLEDGHGDEQT